MNVNYQLSPVNFPLKILHCLHRVLNTLFGYVTGSNQQLYLLCHVSLSVQPSKLCDKHGDKDEDNSPKNVNNVHNTSSQKYRQIKVIFGVLFLAFEICVIVLFYLYFWHRCFRLHAVICYLLFICYTNNLQTDLFGQSVDH